MPVLQRRPRWAWIAAGAVVLIAVIVLGILHARSTNAPVARSGSAAGSASHSASSSAPRPNPALPVGITFGGELFGLSRTAIDEAMRDVRALHMTWVRIDFSWASLQPRSASAYDWKPMDAIVDSARDHSLRILGLLSYTPGWARAEGCRVFVCPPRSDAQFARFAAAVAERYRDDVTSYQIWNEPNIDLFWRSPDPDAYGRLLAATTRAIRGVDDAMRILFGGLAFTDTTGGDIAPTRFLAATCAGRTCDVDAVGYDPFTYPDLPSEHAEPPNAWQLMAGDGGSGFPAALARAGLGGMKIWVTEFGAPTDFAGSTSGARTVGENQQAAIVVDGLRLAQQDPAHVGAFFVDTWRDAKHGGTARDHFGVQRADGTHKPAFGALERALRS